MTEKNNQKVNLYLNKDQRMHEQMLLQACKLTKKFTRLKMVRADLARLLLKKKSTK